MVDSMMVAVISQHLLSSELGQLETQLARLNAPQAELEALMRMGLTANSAETLADCRHVEMTLQAVRCELTATDAELQSALQTGDELLREATTQLFRAQDELSKAEQATELLRSCKCPPSTVVPPPIPVCALLQQQTPQHQYRSVNASSAEVSSLPSVDASTPHCAFGVDSSSCGRGGSSLGSTVAAVRAAAASMSRASEDMGEDESAVLDRVSDCASSGPLAICGGSGGRDDASLLSSPMAALSRLPSASSSQQAALCSSFTRPTSATPNLDELTELYPSTSATMSMSISQTKAFASALAAAIEATPDLPTADGAGGNDAAAVLAAAAAYQRAQSGAPSCHPPGFDHSGAVAASGTGAPFAAMPTFSPAAPLQDHAACSGGSGSGGADSEGPGGGGTGIGGTVGFCGTILGHGNGTARGSGKGERSGRSDGGSEQLASVSASLPTGYSNTKQSDSLPLHHLTRSRSFERSTPRGCAPQNAQAASRSRNNDPLGMQTLGQRTQRQRFVGLKPQVGQAEQLQQRAERREQHEQNEQHEQPWQQPWQQPRQQPRQTTSDLMFAEESIAPTLSQSSVQPQLVFSQTEKGIRLVYSEGIRTSP